MKSAIAREVRRPFDANLSPPPVQRVCEPSTLVDIVRSHAEKRANETAFVFLKNGEVEDGILTFAMLDERARSVAARLQESLGPGDRAILFFPSGVDFIVAFLGCMYAGVIAVPVCPPRKQQGLEKLCAIAGNCSPKVIITDEASRGDLAQRLCSVPALAKLRLEVVSASADSLSASDQRWDPPLLNPSSIAFLQYTSGSTGTPKGIAVKHGSLLANEQMIAEAFGHGPDTVVAGWLPFHHDMGLVGNILNPLYLGVRCILMSPIAFTQQPIRWLQAVSKYRATTSGGPNFAYDICVRRISSEQTQGLDLSSWRVAFSGAEPVRAETLERFSEKFAPVGFRRRAFYPCYGMAEATLFASGPLPEQGPVVTKVLSEALERNDVATALGSESGVPIQALVGCGFGRGDQRILIVDPDTKLVCSTHCVGEIWLQGSNVANRYWDSETATAESFGGYLADSGEGPFLRTGDLGFLSDGQLFVVGRRKELIIINGRNLYPHDIEDLVSRAHPILDGCAGAAFSLDLEGEERLIVVHEVSQRRVGAAAGREVTFSARAAVANALDVQLYDLVLVPLGAIPRTTSGKKQRNLCRDLYRKQALPVLGADE